MTDLSKRLSRKELQDRLKIGNNIFEQIKNELPVIRIGKRKCYILEEVQIFLREKGSTYGTR